MRLQAGSAAVPFEVETITGDRISLHAFAGTPVLLMFFRYASCPMCNLRLHDLAGELPRLAARGLQSVAVFHSSARRVRAAAGSRRYPLHLVADPRFALYRAYGVETSWPRMLLSFARPGFYVDWVRSMRHGFWGGVDMQMAKLPADFLIAPDGTVARAHYGRDIGDHLSLSEIETFVEKSARR
jgi:peroxiredoxin